MVNKIAKVGDLVGFKSDIEQYAKVIKVVRGDNGMGRRTTRYIVEAPADGFSGDYISGARTHMVDASDCFDDED